MSAVVRTLAIAEGDVVTVARAVWGDMLGDRKSTRLNSSHT